jgi:hypothetical protein
VEVTTSREESGHVFDVFDGGGRYLGPVHFPFSLSASPAPILRDGVLWGISRDELDVISIVRARVLKSPGDGG